MNDDFIDFFALLNRHDVEFLIIGGVAYNFHAPPRATKDIDVWVRPTRSNLEDLIRSKQAAGRPRDLADVAMLEKILGRK